MAAPQRRRRARSAGRSDGGFFVAASSRRIVRVDGACNSYPTRSARIASNSLVEHIRNSFRDCGSTMAETAVVLLTLGFNCSVAKRPCTTSRARRASRKETSDRVAATTTSASARGLDFSTETRKGAPREPATSHGQQCPLCKHRHVRGHATKYKPSLRSSKKSESVGIANRLAVPRTSVIDTEVDNGSFRNDAAKQPGRKICGRGCGLPPRVPLRMTLFNRHGKPRDFPLVVGHVTPRKVHRRVASGFGNSSKISAMAWSRSQSDQRNSSAQC